MQEFVDKRLLADGMISPEDLRLYKLTDSVDEAVARDPAVLPRLPQHAVRAQQARVPAATSRSATELLADINADFADILADGKFS